MSVVVYMPMPNGCHWRNQNAWSGMKDCPASDYEEGNCLLDPLERNTADYVEKRPPWCPIICQLPEGHGRLGDLDELQVKVNQARIRVMQDGKDTNPYWECGDIVCGQKTIVPAERSEP